MNLSIGVGDWVQAVRDVTEGDFLGHGVWTHASKGAVGHVLGVEADGSINVYWERTGTVTICDPVELARLCSADAGKTTSV